MGRPRLRAGDHIYVERSLYDHHGIYVGDGQVVHYDGTWWLKTLDATIEEVSLDEFAAGDEIELVRERRAYSRKRIVSRALSQIGKGDYSLFNRNCEHFASWCATGRATGSQTWTDEAQCRECEDGAGWIPCDDCDGTGEDTCYECENDGEMDCEACEGGGETECPECDGDGADDDDEECSPCNGSGSVTCKDACGDGRVPCDVCGGTPAPCTECEGAGELECEDCRGTGAPWVDDEDDD